MVSTNNCKAHCGLWNILWARKPHEWNIATLILLRDMSNCGAEYELENYESGTKCNLQKMLIFPLSMKFAMRFKSNVKMAII